MLRSYPLSERPTPSPLDALKSSDEPRRKPEKAFVHQNGIKIGSVIFGGGKKTGENPEKNLQSQEPTANSVKCPELIVTFV